VSRVLKYLTTNTWRRVTREPNIIATNSVRGVQSNKSTNRDAGRPA
jgi:hypothetical protein